jgi:hypothetical protein
MVSIKDYQPEHTFVAWPSRFMGVFQVIEPI